MNINLKVAEADTAKTKEYLENNHYGYAEINGAYVLPITVEPYHFFAILAMRLYKSGLEFESIEMTK